MEENPKKQNSNENNERLSSLSQPRDLHLPSASGNAKPKKVYIPNLNAVRNKSKNVPSQASSGTRRNNTRKREFKKGPNNESKYIQSTGIFSEGTVSDIKRQTHSDRAADTRDGDASEGMVKPTINSKAVWDIDETEEADVINRLLETENGSDIKVKQEPVPVYDEAAEHMKCSFATPKLFSDENIALSLFKLPLSLPAHAFDKDDKVIDCTLDQLNEGKIGKIIKRRSGKMEVNIGNMSYSIEPYEFSFTKVLAVAPDPEPDQNSSKNPIFSQVGAIGEVIIVIPDFY